MGTHLRIRYLTLCRPRAVLASSHSAVAVMIAARPPADTLLNYVSTVRSWGMGRIIASRSVTPSPMLSTVPSEAGKRRPYAVVSPRQGCATLDSTSAVKVSFLLCLPTPEDDWRDFFCAFHRLADVEKSCTPPRKAAGGGQTYCMYSCGFADTTGILATLIHPDQVGRQKDRQGRIEIPHPPTSVFLIKLYGTPYRIRHKGCLDVGEKLTDPFPCHTTSERKVKLSISPVLNQIKLDQAKGRLLGPDVHAMVTSAPRTRRSPSALRDHTSDCCHEPQGTKPGLGGCRDTSTSTALLLETVLPAVPLQCLHKHSRRATMSNDEGPTPLDSDIPGGWPNTPATIRQESHTSYLGRQTSNVNTVSSYQSSNRHVDQTLRASNHLTEQDSVGRGLLGPSAHHSTVTVSRDVEEPPPPVLAGEVWSAAAGVPSVASEPSIVPAHAHMLEHPTEEVERPLSATPTEARIEAFQPAKADTAAVERPKLQTTPSKRQMTEEDLIAHLSRRNSVRSGGKLSRTTTQTTDPGDQAEIDRLMSRMFGRTRQEHSEEEKTRHLGVVFKNLTVKGMGLGAALQPTFGDVFLGMPRAIGHLFSRGPRKAAVKPPIKTILDDFSGVIRPGEMCLVLGRPGSGCSTFLKVLGNQRFGYESIDGEVTYGGTDSKTMLKKYRGEVVYNPEDDLHYATLSVKATLKFALQCKTPGKESRNENETATEYVANFLKSVVKLFWIEHTLDTKVGDEHVRGVSGGEKKRVSIAEALITKASTQAWDNSTRGLDASTALEYVESLRSLTNMAHISTAVALYQAGERLYSCFDKNGHCAYFGHADDAVKYFEDLGFVRPSRWTSADFLTSVTDRHERHVKDGWEDRIPRSGSEFGSIFKKSEQHQRNLAEIEDFEQETATQAETRKESQSKATKNKNYTIPFHRQVWHCTHRQFLVMFGDKQSLGGKWGGILFQALIVGSLFYNLPDTAAGVFPRGGVLFFMLLFNALLALAELTVFIFDVVVYFMAHLSRTASQFFISLLFLFILTMTMYAFFRAIGALVGSLDIATRVTGVAIQALIVYTGYLIPPGKMHPWFKWIKYINPVQYGFEGLMSNEFYNLEIQCISPFLVPQGPNASSQYQSCTIQGSTPGSTVVQGSDYIEVAYQYSRSHLWRNFGIICGFFIFFVFLTAVGMEIQKPNKGGGAVTIYKRGEVPKDVATAMEHSGEVDDEEKGNSHADSAVATGSSDEKLSGSDSDEPVKGVARNDTIFTWQNVNYTIPVKGGERKLLQNVEGFVRPGRLTALMGASGAGKTTLLNTLAQRINFGTITGDFLVDGKPLPKSFQRSSGFAEQMDVHLPTATVREALRFSAKLRQPREVPLSEKYEYVETIIKLLEMENIAGATIGNIGSGLNQEQRKRLTIGVELASKPELLLFLDEPTSGLDSGAAFNIVRFLRKLVDAGQAVLCTIHQPSAVLFEEFDDLVLLKSGGRLVYHGDLGKDSRQLIDYFEHNGSRKIKKNENPAEAMLEIIGAGNPDYSGPDWGDTWQNSEEKRARSQEIESMIEERRNATSGGETSDEREYAMPLGTQVFTVVHRNFVDYWRSQDYLVGKFMLHIFTGLFNAFTFWNIGHSQIDMQSRLFSIFLTLTICPPLIQQLQPKFLQLRNVYASRERNSKIYGWFPFTCAAILPELPFSFIAGTLYWAAWYWPPNFPRDSYTSASVWLFVMLFEAIAAFSPNELLASLFVPIFFLFVVSFCGVVVPYAALPYFWRSWMYWLSPFKYLLEGMLGLVTHGVYVRCDDSELAQFPAPPGQTCDSYVGPYVAQAGGYVTTLDSGLCGFCQYANGDEFARSFNVYYEFVWRDYGIFWAFCVFNFAVIFFASWIYLGGGKQLVRSLHPATRREKKAAKQRKKEMPQDVQERV
nr:brefeldin a resistance protein [Quercus suber]